MSVKKNLAIEIVKNNKKKIDLSENLLKKLLRLVQITSNPALVDDDYKEIPGKFIILDNLIKKILDRKEKVIIWSSFIKNVNLLEKRFEHYGAVKIQGSMDMESRNKSVQRFISDRGVFVLVATPQAAKEGLTLTVANNAIYLDRSFSLDDYLQSQDRIHRISQAKECNIYNIIIRRTIDEWIDSLVKAKHLSAQLGQGDITRSVFEEEMDYKYSEILEKILSK